MTLGYLVLFPPVSLTRNVLSSFFPRSWKLAFSKRSEEKWFSCGVQCAAINQFHETGIFFFLSTKPIHCRADSLCIGDTVKNFRAFVSHLKRRRGYFWIIFYLPEQFSQFTYKCHYFLTLVLDIGDTFLTMVATIVRRHGQCIYNCTFGSALLRRLSRCRDVVWRGCSVPFFQIGSAACLFLCERSYQVIHAYGAHLAPIRR